MKNLEKLYDRLCEDARLGAGLPNGWRELRRAGYEAFCGMGLPTKGWEGYRYTPIARRLAPAVCRSYAQGGVDAVVDPAIRSLPGYHVVVTGGGISLENGLPRGVSFDRFAEEADVPEGVAEKLGGYAGVEEDPLVALNSACFRSLLALRVGEGVVVGEPIYVHHMGYDAADIAYPRSLLLMEGGSQATIVDVVYPVREYPLWVNGVTERYLCAEAQLTRVLWHYEPTPYLYGWGYEYNGLEAGSVLRDISMRFGGGMVRHSQVTRLLGRGSRASFYGCYLAKDHDYVAHHHRLVHCAPATRGHTYYKGVGMGRSQCVFRGQVDVKPSGQKTSTAQYHHGWALEEAEVYARPELAIEADDVVCRHGATVGRGIDAMLFYLRTRGLSLSAARACLLKGFLKEVVAYVGVDGLQTLGMDGLDALCDGCL